MMADVAGVSAREVADARRGSRLSVSAWSTTWWASTPSPTCPTWMKVSDQLPSMLMREYRSEQELMAESDAAGGTDHAAGRGLRPRRAGPAGRDAAAAGRARAA